MFFEIDFFWIKSMETYRNIRFFRYFFLGGYDRFYPGGGFISRFLELFLAVFLNCREFVKFILRRRKNE